MGGGSAADDGRQSEQLMANAKLALRRLASSVSVVTCRHDGTELRNDCNRGQRAQHGAAVNAGMRQSIGGVPWSTEQGE